VSQEELTADPMERVAHAAPVAQGLLLDSAADLVQGAVGQPDGVEVIDDNSGVRQSFGQPTGVAGVGVKGDGPDGR
jgi:hypothetical protein